MDMKALKYSILYTTVIVVLIVGLVFGVVKPVLSPNTENPVIEKVIEKTGFSVSDGKRVIIKSHDSPSYKITVFDIPDTNQQCAIGINGLQCWVKGEVTKK